MDIYDFLDSKKVEKGCYHTHTSMGKPFGSYNISGEAVYRQFLKLYYEGVFEKKIPMYIIEKHEDVGPIVIDLDFKKSLPKLKPVNKKDRLYTQEAINKFIEAYIGILKDFIIVPEDKQKIFVLEKNEMSQKNECLVDGIHIQFPYINANFNLLYMVRERFLRKHPKIFEKLGLSNSLKDIFDRAVIHSSGWLLYGCSKPSKEPYVLTGVYDFGLNKLNIRPTDFELIQILSIRNKTVETQLTDQGLADLSIYIQNKNNLFKNIGKPNVKKITPEQVQNVFELVAVLNKERAEDYRGWLEVGMCLHNIDPASEELLNTWVLFSKLSPKFKEGECERQWMNFRDEGLGVGSLHYWARLDNPTGYGEIRRKNLQFYIEKSVTATNWDVAMVLYQLFKYQYVCACSKTKMWYEFKNHRWTEVDDGILLRQRISADLVNEYCHLIDYYNDKFVVDSTSEDMDAQEKADEYLDKCKALSEIVIRLKNTTFKDQVMKEARELFYDKDFLGELDGNLYLLGFNNGVYDMKNFEFRDGKPEDRISFTSNIDYIDYCDSNDYVHEIFRFFDQVFPNPVIRDYVLMLLSTYLQGHNAEETFHIWTGSGGNGKSKVVELFELCMGDYCIKFPITLLTGKRAASNAATPEIMQSKGKRFGNFQEPDEHERINVGLLKELTGGDRIKARGLYSQPIEFKPQFKLLLCCNQMPTVPPDDDGTWRRLRVVEFKSRFVDNPQAENEFPKDRYLSEKLIIWKETFMSILIEYYKLYRKDGLVVPDEVVKYTHDYQKSCDVYADWVVENLELTGNILDAICLDELHLDFKNWFQDNFNSQKHPTKRDFKKYLEKRFGKDNVKENTLKCHILKKKEITQPLESEVMM